MFLQNTVAINVNKKDKNADDEKGSLTTSLDDEFIWNNSVMNSPITLNVGGLKYTTTKATLSTVKDTFLYKMFIETKFKVEPLDDGSYFIDRDGQHFRFILNFLRDGFVNIGNESIVSELLQEAMFYQIQPLIKHLEMMVKTKPTDNVQSRILSKYRVQRLSDYFKIHRWQRDTRFDASQQSLRYHNGIWQCFRSAAFDDDHKGISLFIFKVRCSYYDWCGFYLNGSDVFVFSPCKDGRMIIQKLKLVKQNHQHTRKIINYRTESSDEWDDSHPTIWVLEFQSHKQELYIGNQYNSLIKDIEIFNCF